MLNFNFGIGILIFAYDATPMVNIVKKSLSGSIMARQVVCRLMSSPVVNRRPSYDGKCCVMATNVIKLSQFQWP